MAFRQAKLKLANPSFPTTANATVTSSNIPTVTNRVLASGSLGYTSDAAWYAIRRYMQANPFDDQIVSFIYLILFCFLKILYFIK